MSSPDSKEISLVRCIKCGKILTCSRYDTAALLEHIRTDHPEVDVVDTDTKKKRTIGTEIERPVNKIEENSKQENNDDIQEFNIGDTDVDVESFPPYHKEEQISYEHTEDEEREMHWPKQQQYVKDVDLSHYSVTSEILAQYPEIKECEYSPHNPNAQVAYTRRYKITTPTAVSASILKQPFHTNLYRTSIERWRPANGVIFCPKCSSNKRPLIKTKAERYTYSECSRWCIMSCWPFCFLPWICPGQSYEYLYCANCKTFLGLYDSNTNCVRPNRLYITPEDIEGKEKDIAEDRSASINSKVPENHSPAQSLVGGNENRNDITSITVNGKELPPETVARLKKLKKYSSLIGIDMNDLTNPPDTPSSNKRNGSHRANQGAAPSAAKQN